MIEKLIQKVKNLPSGALFFIALLLIILLVALFAMG